MKIANNIYPVTKINPDLAPKFIEMITAKINDLQQDTVVFGGLLYQLCADGIYHACMNPNVQQWVNTWTDETPCLKQD